MMGKGAPDIIKYIEKKERVSSLIEKDLSHLQSEIKKRKKR